MYIQFYRSLSKIAGTNFHKKFIAVSAISIITSILETITIGCIFPFMNLVTDPNKVHQKYYSYLYDLLNFNSASHFIAFLGAVIIILFIIKTLCASLANFIFFSFGQNVTQNLKVTLLQSFFEQKYVYYLRENKSSVTNFHEVLNTLATAVSGLSIAITEMVIVIIMYFALMIFNWKIMTCITIFLALNVMLVQRFIHPLVKQISEKAWKNSSAAHKYLNSIVHNYKLLKLSSNYNIQIFNYKHLISKYHNSECQRQVIDRQPKNLLELSGFLIMIGLIIYQELMHGRDAITTLIPIISLLMLTFYRLLPSLTRAIEVRNSITYVTPLIRRAENELAKKIEAVLNDNNLKTMQNDLKLANIKFSYNGKKNILSEVSLKINKGEHIAFVGSSGSGKSTLIDIIMGLYAHEDELYHLSGNIIIDDEILTDSDLLAWRKNIGYIPQEIYLFDGTVAENVVMNSEFDEEKVIVALKKAFIWDFLQQKEGFHTQVGDGGIMLSGGQKQRIGIARALYNNPDIIIMDEATSALDDHTESQIIEELNNSAHEKTIIMIAHRISSLKNCDRIYKIDKGAIVATYNNIQDIN